MHDYEQALERDPNDPDILFLRGRAYARQGDIRRAMQDLDLAVALGSTDAEYRLARAQTLLTAGRVNAAVTDLDQAIAIDSKMRPPSRCAAAP